MRFLKFGIDLDRFLVAQDCSGKISSLRIQHTQLQIPNPKLGIEVQQRVFSRDSACVGLSASSGPLRRFQRLTA